jgi:hypothetical protein
MATSPSVPESTGRKRLRSPAYPFINLETAIKRAGEFYAKEKHNSAPLKVAVRHWGYEEKSSGGLQTAAALISFGLMRDEGTGDRRKLKLTENALRILLDPRPESEDRVAAIRAAALTPKIHQQLWRKWHNGIPSDDNVKHFLILELKPPFNPGVADGFIKQYKDTIAFARPDDSAMVPLANDDVNAELETALEGPTLRLQARDHAHDNGGPVIPITPGGPGRRAFPPPVSSPRALGSSIPVSESCAVSISASGEITQKGIDRLIAYLTLIKESFPET